MLEKGEVLITIESDSMFPVLKKGDKVIVCSSDTYKIGDIIVFRPLRREHYISHRVIWKSGKFNYYTKGDNSHMYDERICKERILGKIVGVIEKDSQSQFKLRKQKLLGILSLWEIIILIPFIIFPGVWEKRIKIMRMIHNAYYRLVIMPISKRGREVIKC